MLDTFTFWLSVFLVWLSLVSLWCLTVARQRAAVARSHRQAQLLDRQPWRRVLPRHRPARVVWTRHQVEV